MFFKDNDCLLQMFMIFFKWILCVHVFFCANKGSVRVMSLFFSVFSCFLKKICYLCDCFWFCSYSHKEQTKGNAVRVGNSARCCKAYLTPISQEVTKNQATGSMSGKEFVIQAKSEDLPKSIRKICFRECRAVLSK